MSMALKYGMKKRMAKGGGVHKKVDAPHLKGGMSKAGLRARVAKELGDHPAGKESMSESKEMHRDNLEELRSMKKPNLPMAQGGDVVDRIMKKRGCYSEGGKVANSTEVTADEMPNEFDDLVLRDDLESSYTAENSGDHLGNEQLRDDEADMIARIMKSRAKRDRMPRPA